jgi:phage terminase small subunit
VTTSQQEPDRIDKKKIPEAINALKELKPKELPDVSAKEAIRQMRRYINGALKKNYTYEEIAEVLSGLGINISGSRLKYLLSELNKNTRRKKRKITEESETEIEKGEENTSIRQNDESSQPIENGNKSNLKGRTARSIKVKSQEENPVKTPTKKGNRKDSKSQGNTHSFQPQVYNDDDL